MPQSQPQSRTLECKNLHDYLKTLQADQLDNLYNHPATCLAVFRELPPLAKQIVMRLIFVEQAVPQAVVASWVTAQSQAESQIMKERLSSLKLWSATKMPGGLEAWLLNKTFRKKLRMALSGGGQPWTMSAYLEPDPRARDVEWRCAERPLQLSLLSLQCRRRIRTPDTLARTLTGTPSDCRGMPWTWGGGPVRRQRSARPGCPSSPAQH